MSDHDGWCGCDDCADGAVLEAERMMGDGVTCTGCIGCRCHECRAEEAHLALWAEKRHAEERESFEASMRGAAKWELTELLDEREDDTEGRRSAFEIWGGDL